MQTVRCPECGFTHIIFKANTESKIICTNCGNSFEKNEKATAHPDAEDTVKHTIQQLLKNGEKLLAIKTYQDKTGCDLAEAKRYVDGFEVQHKNVPNIKLILLSSFIVAVFIFFAVISYFMLTKTDHSDTYNNVKPNGTFTDTRDGNVYKFVKIGNQVWMAENLNYKTKSGSWCYADESANCQKYGRLYDWETAQEVAPEGWHLPNYVELDTLLKHFAKKGENAYEQLISGGASGFNALFMHWRNKDGYFENLDSLAYFWSATSNYTEHAWGMEIYGNKRKVHIKRLLDKNCGFSVRCIKN